jgi:peroxiredoxin/predicted small lipoprotein YifL
MGTRFGLVWIAAALALALAGCGGSSKAKGPLPSANQAAADDNAPASLVAAATKSGFYLASEPGTATIESRPATAAQPPRSTLLLDEGSAAPDFTLRTPQGEQLQLAALRGKAVLLEFFATWCGLCNAEAPHLKKLAESLPASKYAFVSINADGEDAGSVFAYHRYHELEFPSLLDPGVRPGTFRRPRIPGPVSQEYGMKSLPTFYVIGRDGNVSWRSDGEQHDAKLREELERAAAA